MSTSSSAYSSVRPYEDLDTLLEPPVLQQSFHRPPPASFTCAYFCFFFSVLAVAFLSTIASMLSSNSMYVHPTSADTLYRGVVGVTCGALGPAAVFSLMLASCISVSVSVYVYIHSPMHVSCFCCKPAAYCILSILTPFPNTRIYTNICVRRYLQVDTGKDSGLTKKDLAKNVEYAAMLYVLCALFSALLIACHRCTQVEPLHRSGRHYVEYDDGYGFMGAATTAQDKEG